MFGFFRVAAAVPDLKVADINYNTNRIIEMIRDAARKGVSAITFPELSITGASCGDLYSHQRLLEWSEKALMNIAAAPEKNQIVIVGMPICYHDGFYNCACILQNGKVMGIVPKSVVAFSREGAASRCFSSGVNIKNAFVKINGMDDPVPFGTDLLFSAGEEFKFSVEIGEDFWVPTPPSALIAEAGARVIFNLSASPEVVGKADFRINMLASQSARCFACYVYSASGNGESTTRTVSGGHAIIAENGRILGENPRFQRSNSMLMADVDVEKLAALRRNDGLFENIPTNVYRNIQMAAPFGSPDLAYANISNRPFVPQDPYELSNNCSEVLAIQSSALASRIEHIDAKKLVIGISGGLDSTLALVASVQALKMLDRPVSDILAVTMPGFGTTEKTYNNASALCELMGVTLLEANICESSEAIFKAIGQDTANHDIVFENVQARQRTAILMNLANMYNGMVIGTGDLSEIALGWNTYNGDHMSMYNVNCSVPKTLIPAILAYFAESVSPELRQILSDIVETPASPELVPPGEDGKPALTTEERIGPYALHDFFLYHFVRYGAGPDKLRFLAENAFKEYKFTREYINEVLITFLKRFFASQYKRNCAPDGPKVGTVDLSSHGSWEMPSDISSAIFMAASAPGSAAGGSGANISRWKDLKASISAQNKASAPVVNPLLIQK